MVLRFTRKLKLPDKQYAMNVYGRCCGRVSCRDPSDGLFATCYTGRKCKKRTESERVG